MLYLTTDDRPALTRPALFNHRLRYDLAVVRDARLRSTHVLVGDHEPEPKIHPWPPEPFTPSPTRPFAPSSKSRWYGWCVK